MLLVCVMMEVFAGGGTSDVAKVVVGTVSLLFLLWL